MSVIQEFTVQPGQTEVTFRLQKSAQHLLVRRKSLLAILAAGLVLGLPEKVSAEITHPTRKRITQADRVPLSHIAAWAQFGRGPIVETAPATALADANFGEVHVVNPENLDAYSITTEVHYYLNQSGSVELVSDDQYTITMTGLVPGAHYTIQAPEMPVSPATGQQLYQYEQSLILAGDREKELYVGDCVGLIMPNRPDAIERVIISIRVDENTVKDCPFTLNELLAVQADKNPFVSLLNYESERVVARGSVLNASGEGDLLVIMLTHAEKVEIHTVLGKELDYTLVKVGDRNNA